MCLFYKKLHIFGHDKKKVKNLPYDESDIFTPDHIRSKNFGKNKLTYFHVYFSLNLACLIIHKKYTKNIFHTFS